jgi:hypothetical protein
MGADWFQQNVLGPEASFVSFFKLMITREYLLNELETIGSTTMVVDDPRLSRCRMTALPPHRH